MRLYSGGGGALTFAAARRTIKHYSQYLQGYSPSPGVREYFYFIDHQGQLFLDDAKHKNFTSCFKDKAFLAFFFKRLKVNASGKYSEDFPFVSPCGREMNYIRCYDRPVVFQHVLDCHSNTIEYEDIATFNDNEAGKDVIEQLSYGGVGCGLVMNFQPHLLHMSPVNGHVYHPASEKTGGYGLVASKLAFWLSKNFIYNYGDTTPPSHFMWKSTKHKLDNTWTNDIQWKVHLDDEC